MSLEWVEIEREDADYIITASSELLSFVVMKPKGHEHYLAIYIENKTMSPRFQMISPTEIQAKLSCEELVAVTDDLDADEVDELLTEFTKQYATF